MKIAVDTHCHSVASGHAYSTVEEMARAARRLGLRGFVLSDHGPGMEGTTHRYHFGNLGALPQRMRGVRLYRGVEANIMDFRGRLDLEEYFLKRLDFVMAGLHEICLDPSDAESNTRAIESALANPYVDSISHPGNPAYPLYAERVIAAAALHRKTLEINASSFRVRTGSEDNCLEIARLCAKAGLRVCLGSDAHWSGDVGRLDGALEVVKKAGLPRALIVNATLDSFEAYLRERQARITQKA